MTTAAILAFCKSTYKHIWMSESFRGLILARFWETRGFLLLFDCPKVLRWDSQIKGKDFLELFPGLKSEDHLFFFCGEQTAAAERKRGPSTVLQRLPQYIKRQIFHFHHFHLYQIYNDPQASLYQEEDFTFQSFSSLSNISSSSSLNISRGRFLIFIFVEYINLLKPQH